MANKTDITIDTVKDTDMIVIENNQTLTTSLKVAEYFGKQHKRVIQTIEEKYGDLHETVHMFQRATVKDSYGREQPVYLMNRDGFTLLAMGFTGEKALQWKLRYIGAFNRMEEALCNQQQNRPMSSLEILQHQVKVMTELKEQTDQNTAGIKSLRQAHNGMALRHEGKLLQQQQRLDHHDEEISDIKNTIATRSPRSDIRIFIADMVNKYKDPKYGMDFGHAYECFYAEVRRVVGLEISKEQEALREKRRREGWSKSKLDSISKLDTIEDHPETWSAIKSLISGLREEYDI